MSSARTDRCRSRVLCRLSRAGNRKTRGIDEPMTASSDVTAAIAGEPSALEALWCSHRGWVAAVLLAHAPQRTDVDDLLQDVAVALVRGIRGLKDEKSLRPWLRTIAVNAARSAARTAAVRRRCDRSHDQPIASAIDPEPGAA